WVEPAWMVLSRKAGPGTRASEVAGPGARAKGRLTVYTPGRAASWSVVQQLEQPLPACLEGEQEHHAGRGAGRQRAGQGEGQGAQGDDGKCGRHLWLLREVVGEGGRRNPFPRIRGKGFAGLSERRLRQPVQGLHGGGHQGVQTVEGVPQDQAG